MSDKAEIREAVWDQLEAAEAARFPFPPHGRIPNFDGAEDAASRLAATSVWQDASTVKANPDAPQLPVRRQALGDGKLVYMAVPRLTAERCFLELDPAEIDDLESAPTVSNVESVATPRAPGELPAVDLVVVGSVAVTRAGARIGKGEGYSDLEFALLSESGRVGPETTVVTTVHEIQLLEEPVPTAAHDVPIDLICTPERTIRTDRSGTRPKGIDWDALATEKIEAIPALAARAPSWVGND